MTDDQPRLKATKIVRPKPVVQQAPQRQMTFGEIAEIRYRKKVDLRTLPSESTLNVNQAATVYGVQRSLLQAQLVATGRLVGNSRGFLYVYSHAVWNELASRCGSPVRRYTPWKTPIMDRCDIDVMKTQKYAGAVG